MHSRNSELWILLHGTATCKWKYLEKHYIFLSLQNTISVTWKYVTSSLWPIDNVRSPRMIAT